MKVSFLKSWLWAQHWNFRSLSMNIWSPNVMREQVFVGTHTHCIHWCAEAGLQHLGFDLKHITRLVFILSFNKQKLLETLWEFFQGNKYTNELLSVHWLIFCNDKNAQGQLAGVKCRNTNLLIPSSNLRAGVQEKRRAGFMVWQPCFQPTHPGLKEKPFIPLMNTALSNGAVVDSSGV